MVASMVKITEISGSERVIAIYAQNDVFQVMTIRCCDVSADGSLATYGGRDGIIHVVDLETDDVIHANIYENIDNVALAMKGQTIAALTHKSGERRLAIFSFCKAKYWTP